MYIYISTLFRGNPSSVLANERNLVREEERNGPLLGRNTPAPTTYCILWSEYHNI